MAPKNSPSSHTWKCTGTKENPHPEVENNGHKCRLNGCGVSRPYSAPPLNKGLRKYAIASITAGIIVLVSAVGYGLYQLFKPCPPDYQKEGFICVEQNIFRNPNRE
jgi:hypothetical protein